MTDNIVNILLGYLNLNALHALNLRQQERMLYVFCNQRMSQKNIG